MENSKNIREWRAEEISKLFLLKTDYKFNIEDYPTPLFDFFVTLKDKPEVRFAVEVKTQNSFNPKIKKQLESIKIYRDSGMINIPVFIFKIDQEKEIGEFDFLVLPSFNEDKLLVRFDFNFIELNNENFSKKMNTIIKWFNKENKP
ncbi:hypothetical protein [Flavobacterium sp. NRK F7]|uniref:hypothetical protein n=1 Tax=Flavobacterium sp. NRK F7 TaxID=2954930 RepID=UPI0020909ED2|nr:hypothetical protein [Flavobacterium sp. NRK F7]MCO6163688.1 hypothetical protein [Flavobacterium sp. NRK F7]